MKQKIGVFLLSALLVLSLSACGQMSGTDNSGALSDTTTAERNYRQSTSPNNSTNGDNGNNYKQGNKNADNRQGVLEPRNDSMHSGANGSPASGSTGGNNNGISSNGGTGVGGNVSRNGKDEGLFDTKGNSYEQMIRNGLVNDTDGDLTDGENPHS